MNRRKPGAAPALWSSANAEISSLALFLADLLSICVVLAVMFKLRELMFAAPPQLHWSLWYAGVVWFAIRAASGIYSPCSYYPPTELRRSFEISLVVALIHGAFLASDNQLFFYRVIMLVSWPIALPLSYAFRSYFRSKLIARRMYGVPIVVLGNGVAAHRAIRELLARPSIGYVPVAVFSNQLALQHERRAILGVPLVGRLEASDWFSFPYRVNHAILALDETTIDESAGDLINKLSRRYNNLSIFTNLTIESVWLSQVRALGPFVSIQTQHMRFSWQQRALKRAMDIALALPALIVTSPILLVAGIMIKLVDPGPAFFSQEREGKLGKAVRIYKLRTMTINAETELARYLNENSAARFEYERTMKLRNDPRIIPVIGNILRKASIDELPQLWNILRGDMSLVGPRIMPKLEVALYSERGRELRREVPPGLTGFWQVEHRNDSDFRVRETADSFYVSNWSVWLDIWILLRTVRVVLTGSGAY